MSKESIQITTPTAAPSIREYGDVIVECMRKFGAAGLQKFRDDDFRAERILPEDKRPPWPRPFTEIVYIPNDVGKFAMIAAQNASSLDEMFRLFHIITRLHCLIKHTRKMSADDMVPKIVVPTSVRTGIKPEIMAFARRLVADGWHLSERTGDIVKDDEPFGIHPTDEELQAFVEALNESPSLPFVATVDEYWTNPILHMCHDCGMTEREVINLLAKELAHAQEQCLRYAERAAVPTTFVMEKK